MKVVALVLAIFAGHFFSASVAEATDVMPIAKFVVTGDGIAAPLTPIAGDVPRGRAIVVNGRVGMCLLCHQALIFEAIFQGNLAFSIVGVASRSTAAQLRLRLIDGRRLNPDSIMPSYYRVDGLTRVGDAWQSRPILDAQQIEDVVAYLLTLK